MAREPAALLVEGEPGIGKTTIWLAASDQARERGFRVLTTRTAAVESGFAYASLADLLRDVDDALLNALPGPQQMAVDRILLRAGADGAATDQRAVSAAFLTIIEMLREKSPVLIAIDDLQWLDPSSKNVLAFTARRLAARVGLIATNRTDTAEDSQWSSWLQFPKPEIMGRIHLRPFSLGALHAVVSERVGRSFPRPVMTRIYELSQGNPFFAIELARVIGDSSPVGEISIPRTLSEVVQSRLSGLGSDLEEALLAVACLRSATTGEIIRAADVDGDDLIGLLEQAEAGGIITVVGSRVEFTHPLLARGIYDAAKPAQRRKMHRRLAEVVDHAETSARHLALGATREDPATVQALEAAAESARTRGAPAAAAELLELAMQLGGDTPSRRIQTATHYFAAGDLLRARSLLESVIKQTRPGETRAKALHALAVVRLDDDSFAEAAGLIQQGIADSADNSALHVQMLVTLAYALLNSGQLPAAIDTINESSAKAIELGSPHLISMAQSMRVVMRFMRGDGYDEDAMNRALAMEDRDADLALAARPHVQNAMLLGLVGKLERAHHEMLAIRRECAEHGGESELIFIGFHTVLQAVWRGDFTEATLIAEDTMERARQLGGDLPAFIALSVRATVAAYGGRTDDVRRDVAAALEAGQRCSAHTLLGWPISVLGFLEVSLGNYASALATLEPLLAMFDAQPDATEIIPAACLPDAIEALIQLGEFDRAEDLLQRIERNGQRHQRPWMLAVSGRCRGALRAAHGDLDGAVQSTQQAMVWHDSLPMPFERARTQLLLGQLERRRRRREAAAVMLREALGTFESLDIPLWAARAKTSLARTEAKPTQPGLLTASEQRVAEQAAAGMTNRDIAATLFISVKTVEVNLTRVYRKLDIHSRAELGRRMDRL